MRVTLVLFVIAFVSWGMVVAEEDITIEDREARLYGYLTEIRADGSAWEQLPPEYLQFLTEEASESCLKTVLTDWADEIVALTDTEGYTIDIMARRMQDFDWWNKRFFDSVDGRTLSFGDCTVIRSGLRVNFGNDDVLLRELINRVLQSPRADECTAASAVGLINRDEAFFTDIVLKADSADPTRQEMVDAALRRIHTQQGLEPLIAARLSSLTYGKVFIRQHLIIEEQRRDRALRGNL